MEIKVKHITLTEREWNVVIYLLERAVNNKYMASMYRDRVAKIITQIEDTPSVDWLPKPESNYYSNLLLEELFRRNWSFEHQENYIYFIYHNIDIYVHNEDEAKEWYERLCKVI